jgi:hypothetical protein
LIVLENINGVSSNAINAINAITTSQYCNNATLVSKTKMPYTHTHTHTEGHSDVRKEKCTEFPLGLSALLNFDQRLDWLCE